MKLLPGNTRKLTELLQNLSNIQFPRFYSTAVARRTNEKNPENHNTGQIGMFYTIPSDDKKKLFAFGGFPKPFEKNVATFTETCLMIRQPALEIIDYLKRADYSSPVVRYVLYGNLGTGKSLSLAHILHYAYCNGFYLLHVPWVWDWFRNSRTESAPSTFIEGLLDMPTISANWLKHFQSQNAHLLAGDEDKVIKTRKDYIWNQREATPAGSSISELVLYGINRVKYAGAVVSAIITELKMAASNGSCKVLVGVDGFNGFFGTASNIKGEGRKKVLPDQVSLVHCFLEATKQDWIMVLQKGGAVVVIVDQSSGILSSNQSPLPLYLLTRQGFEHLDPFVPVEVKELTSDELHSLLDYYEDRLWLHRHKGRDELAFLSNGNAGVLMKLCGSL